VVLTESRARPYSSWAGAVAITVIGYVKIGGWSALVSTLATHPHPMAGMLGSNVTWGTGNFPQHAPPRRGPSGSRGTRYSSGTRSSGSGTGAASRRSCRGSWRRGMKNRRVSDLFSARSSRYFRLSLCPPRRHVRCAGAEGMLGSGPKTAADTYTFMIMHLLPGGLRGLVAAAMLRSGDAGLLRRAQFDRDRSSRMTS